jgi:F-type H+-transporting ATPase subunit alpha
MAQSPAALAPGRVVRTVGDLTAVDGLHNDVPLGVRVTFGDTGGSDTGVLLARVNGYGVVLRWPPAPPGSRGPGEGTAVAVSRACACVCSPDEWVGRPPVTDLSALVTFAEGAATAGLAWPQPARALMAEQPGVPDRTPITRSLHTGVTGVDVLTPVGRGQCMLLVGERRSGKTGLALDTLANQRHTGVACVYAALGDDDGADARCHEAVAPHTLVLAGPRGASPGVSFLALCASFALGEAWRDAGRDALLVVDTSQPAVAFWAAAAALVPAPEGGATLSEADLVQLDGMLVSASAAERRRFFSSFLQRCARLNAEKGGGSLTLLAVLATAPGAYAFGSGALAAAQAELSAARRKMASYATLGEEQKRKLLAALEAKVAQAQGQQASPPGEAPPGTVSRPVVEEFMSVSDGQIFLQRAAATASPGPQAGWYTMSPRDSVSRIGLEAAAPALRSAGSGAARLELAQADDADAFAAGEAAAMKVQRSAARLRAALSQPPGRPSALSQQVLILLALRAGACPDAALDELSGALHALHAALLARPDTGEALRSIDETGILTAAAEATLLAALK